MNSRIKIENGRIIAIANPLRICYGQELEEARAIVLKKKDPGRLFVSKAEGNLVGGQYVLQIWSAIEDCAHAYVVTQRAMNEAIEIFKLDTRIKLS